MALGSKQVTADRWVTSSRGVEAVLFIRASATKQAVVPTAVHCQPPAICARRQPPNLPCADRCPFRCIHVAARQSAAGSGEGPPERKAWPRPEASPSAPP